MGKKEKKRKEDDALGIYSTLVRCFIGLLSHSDHSQKMLPYKELINTKGWASVRCKILMVGESPVTSQQSSTEMSSFHNRYVKKKKKSPLYIPFF